MAVPYPNKPAPAWFAYAMWNQASTPRDGIFYTTTVTVPLSAAGATAWTAYDFFGNIAGAGSLTGVETSITTTLPQKGWFFFVFTGPSVDPNFANCYCVAAVAIFNNNPNFPAAPAGNTTWGGSTQGSGGTGSTTTAEDWVLKGIIGQTSRLQVTDVTSPAALTAAEADASVVAYPYYLDPAWNNDPARPRALWCQFPNGTVDVVIAGSYLRFYCKDGTVDGSTVAVEITSASGKASTINVYSPASTLKETYNVTSVANAISQINGISNYIWVYNQADNNASNLAKTTIGNAFFTGTTTAVSNLFPLGVTRFEGPQNEPDSSGFTGTETAQRMRLFKAAVDAAATAAIAIGPCPIHIGPDLTWWNAFFQAGGGAYCGELSFHAYTFAENGDLNLGRQNTTAFKALLTQYGQASKPLWQTESTWAPVNVWGVFHPRRARCELLQMLLLEELGVPKERNNPWYDIGHGFWTTPAWRRNEDFSLNPAPVLERQLNEQLRGVTFQNRLVFPGVYDHVFAGWLFGGTGGQVAVVMLPAYMPGATATFSTSATGPLDVYDAWGNHSTVTVSGGQFTINVQEIPAYVHLPAGATLAVVTVNGIGNPSLTDVAGQGSVLLGGTSQPILNRGGFITDYAAQANIVLGPTTLPANLDVVWNGQASPQRLLLWGGSVWQNDSAPVAFTVGTSTNEGKSFTQQTLYDDSAQQTIFQAGSDSLGNGCTYVSFAPDTWIFDLPLNGSACNALRAAISATTYGGEPTLTAAQANTGTGAGSSTFQQIVLQRIAVLGTLGGSTATLQCKTYGNH